MGLGENAWEMIYSGKAEEGRTGGGGVGVSSGGSGSGSGGAGGGGNSSVGTQRQKTTEKIRVEGARRVWGKMKVTTATSLKIAISKFCPVTTLRIKRKTVSDDVGHVKRWWFIIHAAENVLLNL